ncbi:MAG: potassium-transporting ATPase subunit KdpC [Candidatus Berkiella sp.]
MEKGLIRKQIRATLVFLAFSSILFGLCYPGLVTLILQVAFPAEANGSLVIINNQVRGSMLLGQQLSQDRYFWSRPADSKSGSNLSPANPKQFALVKARIEELSERTPSQNRLVPIDLVTTSASGLDPDISLNAAWYQVPRVAKARHLDEKVVQKIISEECANSLWGFSTPHVNVLKLNIALDKISQNDHGNNKT